MVLALTPRDISCAVAFLRAKSAQRSIPTAARLEFSERVENNEAEQYGIENTQLQLQCRCHAVAGEVAVGKGILTVRIQVDESGRNDETVHVDGNVRGLWVGNFSYDTKEEADAVVAAAELPTEQYREYVDPEYREDFETFLAEVDGSEKRAISSGFTWRLHPGKNTLRVRPRNVAGREGTPSWVTLEYR